MSERIYDGGSLNIWSNNYCMLAEVQQESFTGPLANRFDDIKRNSSKQVLQNGPNADTVTF
jgi:hypothetical protein